jgi:D-alanine--poly(phosphoribitol) ligase subunit 1
MDVLDRLLTVAASRPRNPAIDEGKRSVGWEDFVLLVRRLASAMAEAAERPRVLIHLPQQAEAYAAMFAAGMAGGVYACTNVNAPLAKQRLVFGQFEPDLVVSTGALFRQLTDGQEGAARLLDIAGLDAAPLSAPRTPHELAYVMFTSGSTGMPKGVMVPRAGLNHYADWAIEAMNVTTGDRWSQFPNLAFDLSVLDIYGALCGGATLCPFVSSSDRLMPAKAIQQRRLTIWNSVPSVVSLMMQAGQMDAAHLETVRLMTFCGEPLLQEHLDAIFTARPDMLVHNTYGPTEATVSCTLLRLRADDYANACAGSVAIGDAIPGMCIALLGEDGRAGSAGEVVIAGPQVAAGYWRSPELTSRAFRQAEIDGTSQWAYHTGDWAERRGNHVFFRSRIDSQVKVNGFRLELDEVDAAIRKLGTHASCTALVSGELHAFIEGSAADYDVPALRKSLTSLIEAHAVPQHFHFLSVLPRNANDKIDRKQLVDGLAGRPHP